MNWSLKPDLYYSSLYAVDLDELARRGVSAIVIDLDNTIVPRDTCLLDDRGREWVARTKERFKLAIAEDGQILVDKSIAFRIEKGDSDKPGAWLPFA